MVLRKFPLIVLLIILGLGGCNQPTDGGGCEYDTFDFVAEVKDIRPQQDNPDVLDVVLDFNTSTLALEDQTFGELREVVVDSAYFKRNHMRVGIKYTGTVSEIRTGTCNPFFISFNHKFRDEPILEK